MTSSQNFYLGNESLNTGILDVPPELSHGPTGTTERTTIVAQVAQVVLVVGCLVQPRSSPQQLILYFGVSPHKKKFKSVKRL